MTGMADTVFLFDVDNTLLDNDRAQAESGRAADITIDHIGDLLGNDLAALAKR